MLKDDEQLTAAEARAFSLYLVKQQQILNYDKEVIYLLLQKLAEELSLSDDEVLEQLSELNNERLKINREICDELLEKYGGEPPFPCGEGSPYQIIMQMHSRYQVNGILSIEELHDAITWEQIHQNREVVIGSIKRMIARITVKFNL